MSTFWHEIRYAIRRLSKSPGFTVIALITLAIGIGANTIMFSISDVLLFLRARKVKNAEELAYCAIQGVDDCSFRYYEYLTLRDNGLAFSDVMAQITFHDRGTLVHEGLARHVWTTYVSANYFSVLGATPVRGRGFLFEEERPGSAPVVVMSYRCWQRLGSNPKLIGEFVIVNGINCQVVGVASEGFTGVTLNGFDLWLPLGSLRTTHKFFRSRPDQEPWFYVVGRLKPEVTQPVAQAQLQTLFPRFKPECIDGKSLSNPSFKLQQPGRGRIPGDYEQDDRLHAIISLVLISASALILVIACLNIASMLIVQGTSRHREIAVRMAIGGDRWRIIRQLLIESLLLAVLGGVLGVLLALCGAQMLNVWLTAVETHLRIGLNVRVIAATLGLCLMTTLLFGLRPAMLLSKRDIASELKLSTGRMVGSFQRKRGGLSVAGQITLAVALVLSAALLTRSALQMTRPDPRFCLENKLVVELDPLAAGYNRIQSIQACKALADHLVSLPEVKAVGTSGGVFFGGGGWVVIGEYLPGDGDSGAGRPLARKAAFVSVGRDYFEAMEITLLQGRLFDQRDHLPNAENVAIIDESLASKLRSEGNALGCFIKWGVFTKADSDDHYRVVGIVTHVPGIEDGEARAQMYRPIKTNELAPCFCLHVANKGSLDFLRRRITEEIYRTNPGIPVLSVATLAQKRNDNSSVWLAKFGARLALVAGAAALFLASLGIYAIKSYMVASRTSEIGIRMALGATQGSIIGMVLWEGLVPTVVGLIVGLGLGLGVAKVSSSFLYGVSPVDPVSIVVTVALLGAASLLASYIPARRAAKVDPMESFRSE